MSRPEPAAATPQSAAGAADRRRYPRRQVTGVLGTRRSPGDLTVLDLSVHGLAAEAVGEIAPGQHCFLELVHDSHRAHVEAIVRWALVTRVERRMDRLLPVFRAGLSFVDIDLDDTGGIWNWILPAAEESP